MTTNTVLPISSARRYAAAGIAFAAFVVCSAIAWRHGTRLGLDDYFYVEYAKEFRTHLPPSFGSAWPYGWPLLGSLAGLAGLSAYHGLVAWSVLAVAGLTLLGARSLPWERTGFTVGTLALAVAASVFIFSVLTSTVMSEVPFAFTLFAFAYSLGRWPEPGAIAQSAFWALAAFTIRYAGALALLTLGLWFLLHLRQLYAAKRLPVAVVSVGLAAVISGGLVLWNIKATGMASGLARGSSAAIYEWPRIAADLGWCLPAGLGGLGLRNALGFDSGAHTLLGLLLLAVLLALPVVAWWRADSQPTKALGCVLTCYGLGLIALRCNSEFDSLFVERTLVPFLFPLVVLAASYLPVRPLLGPAAVLLGGLSLALDVRGFSLGTGADPRAAVPIVQQAKPGDIILVNDPAHSLTMLIDAPVGWADLRDPARYPRSRFIVLAGKPVDRAGNPGPLSKVWAGVASTLLADPRYVARLQTPSLVVIENLSPQR